MKRSIAFALAQCVAICLIGAAESPAQQIRSVSVSLDRPAFALQENSQLCWAATISNLFAYHGHPVSQTRIVTEVYGGLVNMRSGNYSNLSRLLNRPWQDDSGRPFSSRLTAAMDLLNGVVAITNNTIRDALASNRPLVIGTTNHAMLAVGMRYRDVGGQVAEVLGVDVFDPFPGQGFRSARPEEVTPVPRGGALMFIAEARISSSSATRERTPEPPAARLGRSCQTQLGRCGPFYDQPAMPVGSSCYCGTYSGPVGGVVVQ